MARHPRIPARLQRGPFTVVEAKRAGLQRWHLEGAGWNRIAPRTYVAASIEPTPMLQLQAASRRLPSGAAFSGYTAAWLHGLDFDPCSPIEVTVPKSAGISARSGMALRRAGLPKNDLVKLRGLQATAVFRTLRDISLRLNLTDAVVLCDMALHSGLATPLGLRGQMSRSGRAKGIALLRAALEHVEPASESPMETRLRMLLVLARLPRPEAQVEIRDRWLRFIGRVDLYYADERLALEYDGATHRDKLAEDNRRQNRLLDAGVRLLRFTAGDIYNTPDVVVSQVRAALRA